MLHRASLIVLFAALASFVGCGEAEDPNLPPLAPVTGKVTLDGAPYSGATVIFIPMGNNLGGSASGFTDAEGKYTVQTLHRGDGASAGDYRVAISKFVMPDGSPFPVDSDKGPIDVGAVEQLPPQYSDQAASKLTAKVPAEGGTFDFDLKSQK